MPATDDAKDILNQLRQIVRALRAFDRQAQTKYGLGAAQMFILHVLASDGGITLNELADRTATDQSSVSLAVTRLVEDGHVERVPGKEDRRQVRLSLTKKGRALVRRAPPAAQERIIESVSAMSGTERRQLMKLLEKLVSGLHVKGRPPMFFQD